MIVGVRVILKMMEWHLYERFGTRGRVKVATLRLKRTGMLLLLLLYCLTRFFKTVKTIKL